MTDTPIIEARDVVKRFGNFTAVDRVSFAVDSGVFFGLLGSNGADSVIQIEEPSDALRQFISEREVDHDDLGKRIIIYAETRGALEKEMRSRFCEETCLFRPGNLEDVFLRLTGRELRE